ncbi:MAG: XRE family transcriptional regulator [Candidatus Sumerlaeota bacterium]|nr:XRE family transcriptional regulator [Candidatus Sumerlaeota bacterium]
MEILYHMFIKGDPEMERMLEEETLNAEIARRIYDLRTKAGLTQKELARKIGTTASVISRLEDSDYEGHSLAMLKRIATALDYRVEVRLVPCKRNGAEGRGQTAKRNLSVASK